jgi:hypothetical protein
VRIQRRAPGRVGPRCGGVARPARKRYRGGVLRVAIMTRAISVAVCLASAFAFGCGSGHGSGGGSTESAVRAYAASDACHTHTDGASCGAASGCVWSAIASCPENVACPPGICVEVDPCAAHGDRASCEAAGCAWAALGTALAACAAGTDCGGGACYSPGSGGDACLCACPAYCPAGTECPPCACDCAPGGGGTCTCACPPCAPGEACPPCGCSCDGGGSGGDECGDTCVCDCPECLVGDACPPCGCSCDGGGVPPPAPPPTRTCACPACMPGEPCDPCDCGTTDPCAAHTDAETCRADGANACVWFALGVPCMVDVPCVSGVCQHAPTGGGDGGCVCACPACPAGETCPPCDCDCTGGMGAAGCTPRPAATPGVAVSSRAG